MDMHTGKTEHLPGPGGGMEQDDFIVSMMRIAWRIWYAVEFMPARGISASDSDKELLAWASKNGH